MTKTLTEQWREGTLPEGLYYTRSSNGHKGFSIHTGSKSNMFSPYDKMAHQVEEVLAPVPSYGSLYNPNDGRIPVGLFTVLKLIKRDIEQYQKIRHLTDLECGIKSQVVSLLKRRGWDLGKDELVSNSDEFKDPYITNTEDCQQIVEDNLNRALEKIKEMSQKVGRLEFDNEILDNELKELATKNDTLAIENGRLKERLEIATKALKEYANCEPTEWMSCVTADKALKEMEGVK